MARDDWFRSAAWDEEAQAGFEARLKRSRGTFKRQQYLNIKALSLNAAGKTDAAVVLLHRAVAEDPNGTYAAACHQNLADIAIAQGDWTTAELHYRECMRISPDGQLTTGEAAIGLAEALFGQGSHQEALAALESHPENKMIWRHTVCRWHATRAELAHVLGDPESAQAAAREALAQFDAPDTFKGHPGLGAARLTLPRRRALEALAQGKDPKRGRWFRR